MLSEKFKIPELGRKMSFRRKDILKWNIQNKIVTKALMLTYL